MPEWLLRVDGVNFATTMADTQDLSTLRGGSLTLLNAGDAVRRLLHARLGEGAVETVSIGASQALFRLHGIADAGPMVDEIRSYLRADVGHADNRPLYPGGPDAEDPPPVACMTFVVDAVEASAQRAEDLLTARLRRLQLQSPTLAPHPPAMAASRPCPIEHRLPAEKSHSVRKDMYPGATAVAESARGDEKKILLARSVASRRSYGRSARQRFYAHQLGATAGTLHFADGFEDLVQAPPDMLPQPLHNKIAVIAADGIGFGRLRGKLQSTTADPLEATRRFSDEIAAVQRDALLRPLIEALVRAHARGGGHARAVSVPAERADNPEAVREGWEPILRFETLTYAGDDILWLTPAWLAWEITGFLLRATARARIAGEAPRYRVGVALCARKMPIRKARGLAEELAYKVTDGIPLDERRAGCQLELIESIDVSDGHVDRHRQRIAGTEAARDFTIDGARFDEVGRHVAALRSQRGMPRSQLYRLLRRAVRERAFDAGGSVAVLDDLDRTLKRGGYRYGAEDRELRVDDFDSPLLNAGDGRPLFGLLRLAQLWDVVLPLGEPVLTVPGAET